MALGAGLREDGVDRQALVDRLADRLLERGAQREMAAVRLDLDQDLPW